MERAQWACGSLGNRGKKWWLPAALSFNSQHMTLPCFFSEIVTAYSLYKVIIFWLIMTFVELFQTLSTITDNWTTCKNSTSFVGLLQEEYRPRLDTSSREVAANCLDFWKRHVKSSCGYESLLFLLPVHQWRWSLIKEVLTYNAPS